MSFQVFDINTLIQLGSPVKIKNLKSEAGQKLNGKLGDVVGVQTNGERWVVKYENDEGIISMSSLKIQNLEWAGDRSKLKERYMTEIVNDAGDVVVEGDQVVAGTTSGKNVELVIIQGSKERSEIKDHINAQFLQMGVPEDMWIGGEHPFEQTIDSGAVVKKRSGERFFAALGGGYSKGSISELGIKPPAGGQCVNCGKDAAKTCSSCHTGYCSSNCQKKHWKVHRVECKVERSKKVVAAWKKYDDELLSIDRPDGEAKPLCKKDDDGDMVAWDPVRECRVFFDGEEGAVDTGLIVRYRIRMDDDGDSLLAMLGQGDNGSIEKKDNQDDIKAKMVGTVFYEQPFYLAELFKLKNKGQLLGEKESITQEEFRAELERVAQRECNFTLEQIPIQEINGYASNVFEDAYCTYADIFCNDFFVETYFNGILSI